MKRKIALILVFVLLSVLNISAANKGTTLNVLYDYYSFPVYDISKQSAGASVTRRTWYTPNIGLTYSAGASFPFEYKFENSKVTGLDDSMLVNLDFLLSTKYDIDFISIGIASGIGGEFDVLRLTGTMPTFKINVLLVFDLFAAFSFNNYIGMEVGMRTSSVFLSEDIVSPEYSYIGFSSISIRPYIGFSIFTSDNTAFGVNKDQL